jgi:kinesin family protein 1
MTDTETTVTNLHGNKDEKKFTFDFSFWSHDGYDTRDDGYTVAKDGSNYKDQQYVFDKIGKSVLDNAW